MLLVREYAFGSTVLLFQNFPHFRAGFAGLKRIREEEFAILVACHRSFFADLDQGVADVAPVPCRRHAKATDEVAVAVICAGPVGEPLVAMAVDIAATGGVGHDYLGHARFLDVVVCQNEEGLVAVF